MRQFKCPSKPDISWLLLHGSRMTANTGVQRQPGGSVQIWTFFFLFSVPISHGDPPELCQWSTSKGPLRRDSTPTPLLRQSSSLHLYAPSLPNTICSLGLSHWRKKDRRKKKKTKRREPRQVKDIARQPEEREKVKEMNVSGGKKKRERRRLGECLMRFHI